MWERTAVFQCVCDGSQTAADDDAAVNSELPSVRPGGTTADSYYGVWQRRQVTDSYPALHVMAGIMFEVCTCEWWGRRGSQDIQVCLMQGLITER